VLSVFEVNRLIVSASSHRDRLFKMTYLCKVFVARDQRIFILEGVDLLDHTSIFLLRTINHRVIPIIRILS